MVPPQVFRPSQTEFAVRNLDHSLRGATPEETTMESAQADISESPKAVAPDDAVSEETQQMDVDAQDDGPLEYEVRDVAVGPDTPYTTFRRGRRDCVQYEDKGNVSLALRKCCCSANSEVRHTNHRGRVMNSHTFLF